MNFIWKSPGISLKVGLPFILNSRRNKASRKSITKDSKREISIA